VIILTFRAQLGGFLERLTAGEFGGVVRVEADARRAADKADDIQAGPKGIEPGGAGVEPDARSGIAGHISAEAEVLQSDPTVVAIARFISLERTCRDFATKYLGHLDGRPGSATRNVVLAVIGELISSESVDPTVLELGRRVVNLRNSLVHGARLTELGGLNAVHSIETLEEAVLGGIRDYIDRLP
jgi:hypothetical protein